MLATVGQGCYVMYYELTPALKRRNPANADMIMKQMWWLAFTGLCPRKFSGFEDKQTETAR